MKRHSKWLFALAVGFVATGGCSGHEEGDAPDTPAAVAKLRLDGSGIRADALGVAPWGDNVGFNCWFNVTNTGSDSTSYWEVELQLPNAKIAAGPWNAVVVATSGTTVTLRSNADASVLKPGETVSVNFNGAWSKTPHTTPSIVGVRRYGAAPGAGGASSGGSPSATGGSGHGGSYGGSGYGGSYGGSISSGASAGSTASSGVITGGATGMAGSGAASNNVALSKPSSASSARNENPSTYGNDPDTTTSWCASNDTAGEWWTVDLGSTFNLTGTEVTWPYEGRIYRYVIDISSDGSTFSEIINQRANVRTTKTQTDGFSAQARYLRLAFTELPANSSPCISDFRAFGTPISDSATGGATGMGGTTGSGGNVGASGPITSTNLPPSGGASNVAGAGSGASAGTGNGGSGVGGGTSETVEFFIELAANLELDQVAIATYGEGGSLVLNDGVRLAGATSEFANISSVHSSMPTELGVDTEVNHLYSQSDVTLRGSHVHGNLTTAGSLLPVPQLVSDIDGTTNEHVSLEPIRRIAWNVKFTPGAEPVTLARAATRTISPGAFGSVYLDELSSLTLSEPGIYVVDGPFTMEAGSTLTVANATSQVELYVRGDFTYRGKIQKAMPLPNFIIGVAGTGDAPLEQPFNAILVAPHANVQLATATSGHQASIFAKSVLARPHTTTTQAAFNPDTLCVTGAPRGGLCATQCTLDADCAAGLSCHSGTCGCAQNGTGQCAAREPCTDSTDCQPGLVCGIGEGSRYGVSWANVCLPSSCVNNGPSNPDCGGTSSICGVCPQCANPSGCGPHIVSDTVGSWEEVPGAMNGSFAVSDSGTATYTIPLALPPGRADMTPEVGLVYDSSARQELLGEGWQLIGFSYLSRCVAPASQAGETFFNPLKRRGIRGGESDQLCLDGQQLAPQPALNGSDGGRGYVTVNESFKRIRAYGGTGADAEYFKVWTPEGRILTYGTPNSADGAVVMDLATGLRRVWALTKVEDPSGNFIVYTYSKEEGGPENQGSAGCAKDATWCGTTEIRPEKILYTGSSTLGPDQVPRRAIQFVYEKAFLSQPVTGYIAGVKTTRTRLLNRIDISINDAITKSYLIENVLGPGDVYEVRSIKECEPDAASGYKCKKPTTFDYYSETGLGPGIDSGVTLKPSFESPGEGQFIVWDANGDGWDDVVTAQDYRGSGGQWVQLSMDHPSGTILDPSGTPLIIRKTELPHYQFQGAKARQFETGDDWRTWLRQYEQANIYDADSDGFDDLIDVSPRGQSWGEGLKGGNVPPGTIVQTDYQYPDRPPLTFVDGSVAQANHLEVPKAMFVDVDGDGLSDAVLHHAEAEEIQWRRNIGNGLFEKAQFLGGDIRAGHLIILDMDGDGAMDFVTQPKANPSATTASIANWDGVPSLPFYEISDGYGENWRDENWLYGLIPLDILPIDVNGDGLKDVLVRGPVDTFDPHGTAPVTLYTNTGKGMAKKGALVRKMDHFQFASMRILDHEGDGREDALMWDASANRWLILRGSEGTIEESQLPIGENLTIPGYFEYRRTAKFGPVETISEYYPWSGVADINGDGAQDLLIVDADGHLVYHLGKTALTHMLRRVTDGIGETTEINYGGAAYQRSSSLVSSSQLPTRLLSRVGRPLVSSEYVYRQEGTGYALDHGARYVNRNARVDLAGRGWVGFDRREITHLDGVRNTTEVVRIEYEKNGWMIRPPECIGDCAGMPGPDQEPWRYPFAGVPTTITTARPTVNAERSPDRCRSITSIVDQDWSFVSKSNALTTTGRRYGLWLKARKSMEKDSSCQGGTVATVSTIDETFDIDLAGNVTHHDTWTFNGKNRVEHTVEQSSYVAPDLDRWLLRTPLDVTSTYTRGESVGPDVADFDGEPKTLSVHYDHDALGRLVEIKRGGKQLTTHLFRNAFGNVSRIERSGSGVPTRVTVVDSFDVDEIFPLHLTTQPNVAAEVAVGEPPLTPHTSSFTFDPRTGAMTTSTDANGLTETWSYDGFGRLTRHTRPDGSAESVTYSASSFDNTGVVDVPAVLMTTTTSDGGGVSTEEIDSLGRTVRNTSLSIARAPDGAAIQNVRVVQEILYDYSGRVYQIARPHASGDRTQGVVTYSHNDMDELTSIQHPDGTGVEFDRVEVASMDPAEATRLDVGQHDALAIYRRDMYGNVETRVLDLDGQLTTSLAADGGRVTYEYDGLGGLRYTRAPYGTTERIYDEIGRLVQENDPDRGLHEYTYTAFDELDTHTGPGVNGSSTRLTDRAYYDPFGRMRRWETTDGVYRWHYDQATNGKGKLSAEFVDVGGTVSRAIQASYSYDAQGRLQNVTQRIGGSDYSLGFTYDAVGRMRFLDYPNVGLAPFKVENVYDPVSGVVHEVRDANQPSNRYWKLTETYQGYMPREERVGPIVRTVRDYHPTSGLLRGILSQARDGIVQDESCSYDLNHNLKTREDAVHPGSKQSFEYDALNRLVRTHDVSGAGLEVISYDSAGTGNITSKTGQGTYAYGGLGSAHPHAVRSTTSGRSFDYDDWGNQIARRGGPAGDQTLKYTLFGLPYEITTQLGSVGRVTMLEYGSSGQRIGKQRFLLTDPSDPNSARILESFKVYVGGLYEMRGVCPGGVDPSCASPARTHVYKVYGGGREVAQVHRDEGPDQTVAGQRTYFLHPDQLGSVSAITAGDDGVSAPAAGTILKLQSYSPFGVASVTTAGAPTVYTGFTGLEEDVDEGLVNAGGRLYDASLGRFLSPDPLVPSADWSQGHNSYSYALNNPLNLVDPSGFEPEPPSGTGLGPDAALSPNNVSGAEEMKHLNIAKLKPAERMRLNSRKLSRDVRDKQREHPAAASGSSNGSTSSSGGAVTGKPHSDAGQPGSADGAKSTSAQPGTASAGHGSGTPSAASDEAKANSRNAAGSGAGNSAMDGVTAMVGLMNFETPFVDMGQTGGIPGGRCQGPQCMAGPGPQAMWIAAVAFGSKAVTKAVGVWGAVKTAVSHASAVVARTVDKAADRVSNLARRSVPVGFCFVAGTAVHVADGAVPIENLQVGDRVLTIGQDNESVVNPQDWRHLHLTMPNPDCSGDLLELDTLRPLSWIAETGARPGEWIAFGLPEMGLYGDALVDWIGPIPTIQEGAGRVVLSTVTHFAGNLLQLWLEGQDKPLESTATHRLYSADRGDWIPANELHPGEQLATRDGFATVADITQKNWIGRVYNLEVETEHSYLVGDAGVLSHNTNLCGASGKAWKITREGTAAVAQHGRFGKFYKSKSDGLWWSKDQAGHGNSVWKVFEETDKGLMWKADADEFGNFITGKHKGPTGTFVPWSQLGGGR